MPYPTSCSPQAWASAAPVMMLRSLLRYAAHVSCGGFWVDPHLPKEWGDLHSENAPVGQARITLDVRGNQATVNGLPPGIVFHRGERPPLDDLLELARLTRKP
ncbi:hypothetical protein [Arthrobacter crystallopoietes]|uniref:hypothetical protein n=1 Tax=Crystallibacter crystallopoietes TaxID=37928 RepID=UPI003D1C6C9C